MIISKTVIFFEKVPFI